MNSFKKLLLEKKSISEIVTEFLNSELGSTQHQRLLGALVLRIAEPTSLKIAELETAFEISRGLPIVDQIRFTTHIQFLEELLETLKEEYDGKLLSITPRIDHQEYFTQKGMETGVRPVS